MLNNGFRTVVSIFACVFVQNASPFYTPSVIPSSSRCPFTRRQHFKISTCKQQYRAPSSSTTAGLLKSIKTDTDTGEKITTETRTPSSQQDEQIVLNTPAPTDITSEETIPSGLKAILILTFLVASLSSLDRVAMSVALLPLSSELSLTETAKGAISSSFSFGYGLGIIPCGLLLSAYSPRLAMAYGVSIWSLGTILTPFAAGGGEAGALLLGTRALVGAAESVVLPTVQKILSTRVDRENKSLATAGVYSGFQLGTIMAYLLSPVIMDEIGWRGMFYAYGGVGLLWLVPWLLLVNDRPVERESLVGMFDDDAEDCIIVNSGLDDDASIVIECNVKSDAVTTSETSSASSALPNDNVLNQALEILRAAPWKELFTSRGIIAITLAHAANNWGLYNSLAWIPTFYNEQYGLNVKSSALLSVTPSIAGAIGGILAGTVADYVIRSQGLQDTTNLRKVFQGVALIGPGLTLGYLATHLPDEAGVAQALLTGTVGLQAMHAAGYGPACQEKAGERWAGLVYSITSLPGVMFGTLGVYVTGQLLDLTDKDWGLVFGINSLVFIIGGALFLGLYDGKKEFE